MIQINSIIKALVSTTVLLANFKCDINNTATFNMSHVNEKYQLTKMKNLNLTTDGLYRDNSYQQQSIEWPAFILIISVTCFVSAILYLAFYRCKWCSKDCGNCCKNCENSVCNICENLCEIGEICVNCCKVSSECCCDTCSEVLCETCKTCINNATKEGCTS